MFKRQELELLLSAVNERLYSWGDLPNEEFTKLKRKLKYQLNKHNKKATTLYTNGNGVKAFKEGYSFMAWNKFDYKYTEYKVVVDKSLVNMELDGWRFTVENGEAVAFEKL